MVFKALPWAAPDSAGRIDTALTPKFLSQIALRVSAVSQSNSVAPQGSRRGCSGNQREPAHSRRESAHLFNAALRVSALSLDSQSRESAPRIQRWPARVSAPPPFPQNSAESQRRGSSENPARVNSSSQINAESQRTLAENRRILSKDTTEAQRPASVASQKLR